ncbi:hypothetical protein D3C80_1328110 [compost metagenome]
MRVPAINRMGSQIIEIHFWLNFTVDIFNSCAFRFEPGLLICTFHINLKSVVAGNRLPYPIHNRINGLYSAFGCLLLNRGQQLLLTLAICEPAKSILA